MEINKYIDHTILKPTTLTNEVKTLCEEAMQYDFAAVCVPPPFVKTAKNIISNKIKVATVIGFPFGYSAIEAKIAEIILAEIDGADEFDMVINLLALKNNDWQFLANEINHIVPIINTKNKTLKVIIESGILSKEEILRCCELYSAAGVHYLKTSTGYAEKGASVESVALMRKHLLSHIKIKASGGIKTKEFAYQLIEAGADRIGTSSGLAILNS